MRAVEALRRQRNEAHVAVAPATLAQELASLGERGEARLEQEVH